MPLSFLRLSVMATLAFQVLAALSFDPASAQQAAPEPQRVEFPSLDHQMTLTGYLFLPRDQTGEKVPAIVMMHGRAGPYSTAANGQFDAETISQRHLAWGRLWAENGVAALLVDSFGPRGYAGGFPIHSYSQRPAAVDEVSVRPGDAYAALDYLTRRPDIDAARIGLQGWSNGGSATLAAMNDDIRKATGSDKAFRAAVALYPACGLHGRFENAYSSYAPLRVFSGMADEEVSAAHCERLVARGKAAGSDVEISVFEGATHGFDDPGIRRQRLAANRSAREIATRSILSFMLKRLRN